MLSPCNFIYKGKTYSEGEFMKHIHDNIGEFKDVIEVPKELITQPALENKEIPIEDKVVGSSDVKLEDLLKDGNKIKGEGGKELTVKQIKEGQTNKILITDDNGNTVSLFPLKSDGSIPDNVKNQLSYLEETNKLPTQAEKVNPPIKDKVEGSGVGGDVNKELRQAEYDKKVEGVSLDDWENYTNNGGSLKTVQVQRRFGLGYNEAENVIEYFKNNNREAILKKYPLPEQSLSTQEVKVNPPIKDNGKQLEGEKPLTTEEYKAEKKKLDDEYAAAYDKLPDDVDSAELDAEFADRDEALEKRKPKEEVVEKKEEPVKPTEPEQPIVSEQKTEETATEPETVTDDITGNKFLEKEKAWLENQMDTESLERLTKDPKKYLEEQLEHYQNYKVSEESYFNEKEVADKIAEIKDSLDQLNKSKTATEEKKTQDEAIDNVIDTQLTAEDNTVIETEMAAEPVTEGAPKKTKYQFIREKVSDYLAGKQIGYKLKKIVSKIAKAIRNLIIAGSIVTSVHSTSVDAKGIHFDMNKGIISMLDTYTPQEQGEWAKRYLDKKGLIEIADAVIVESDAPAPVKQEVVKENEAPKVQKFFQIIGTVPDSYNPSDSLISYRSQWDNKDGFRYIPLPTRAEFKNKPIKVGGVVGVGHFMLDASLTPKGQVYAKKYDAKFMRNAIKNNDYIPVFKINEDGSVTVSYKRGKELTKSDLTITPLRQMTWADIDFTNAGKAIGFNSSIKEIKKTDSSGTYLIFKDRSGYSRFSGGSVVFIFKDKGGNTIVRDFAGSLNGIEKEGLGIIKDYGVDPKDLTIGYYDVGSFSAKPKAHDGTISTDQYKGFNNDDWTGGALLIPIEGNVPEKGSKGAEVILGMSLLGAGLGGKKKKTEGGEPDIIIGKINKSKDSLKEGNWRATKEFGHEWNTGKIDKDRLFYWLYNLYDEMPKEYYDGNMESSKQFGKLIQVFEYLKQLNPKLNDIKSPFDSYRNLSSILQGVASDFHINDIKHFIGEGEKTDKKLSDEAFNILKSRGELTYALSNETSRKIIESEIKQLENTKQSWGDQAVKWWKEKNPGMEGAKDAKSSGLSLDNAIIKTAGDAAQKVWAATNSTVKAIKEFLDNIKANYPEWYEDRKADLKKLAEKIFTEQAAKEKIDATTTRGMLEQEKLNAAEIEKLQARHEKQLDRLGTFNTALRDKAIKRQKEEMEALKKRQPYTQKNVDAAFRIGEAFGKLGGEIFGKAEGRKEGVKEEKARQKEMADKIAKVIKDAELNGEITARQAKALASRAAKVGTSKIRFDNFVAYAKKVVEDVEYDANLTETKKLKKTVKRMAHNANLPFVKEFLGVNHNELSPAKLIEYNEALMDMAKKVPDYRLAEGLLANVKALSQSAPKQFDAVKTHADAQQKLTDIFANGVTDVAEYRALIGDVREFKKKINALLENKAITQVEWQQLMDNIYDADGKVVATIKDKVDVLKDELIAEVRNTTYDPNDFTPEENVLITEFEKFKDKDLKAVSAIALDNLVEVVDRMSRGEMPTTQLSDIVEDVVSTRNSKPLLEQVKTSKIKGLSSEAILRKLLLEGSAYAQKILGVARRNEIGNYIFSPISRALHSYKQTVDGLVENFEKELQSLKGSVFKNLTGLKNTHKEYRTAVNKVGMVMQILQERALKNIHPDERNVKMNPERAGERDNFGAMFGNQTELDNYTPAQQAMLRKKAKDFSGSNIRLDKKTGEVTGGLLKDIYDEMLDRFNKGGVLDVEAIYQDIQNGGNNIFTPKEKAVYEAYTKLRERLLAMQSVANAKSGKDFTPVEDYAMRYPLGASKGKKNVSSQRLTSGDIDTVLGKESSTGEERTTNDAYAMETDIEALGLIGIKKSALHFNIASVNDVVNETIDKAIKEAFKNGDEHSAAILEALKLKKNAVVKQEFEFAKLGKVYNNLQKAKAVSALTEIARATSEVLLTVPTAMMRVLGRKELRELKDTPSRKVMMDILKRTNSPMLDKATFIGDRNYDMMGAQEAKEKGLSTKIAHAVNGTAEALSMILTWMPSFKATFKEMTGREFNEHRYSTDADYRKEFAQEIDDAASIADNRTALIFGTSNKGDERQLIQVLPFINKNAVKTTSIGGSVLGFFANYPYRDLTALIHGIEQIANAQNGGRAEGVRQSVGALMGIGAYGIIVGYARALVNSLIGSDDDKERAAKYFEAIKTGDYWKAEGIGTLLQGAASRFSGGGKITTVLLLSAWREIAYNNGNKESVIAIDNILNTQLYSKPVRLDKYGDSQTMTTADMLSRISPATTYAFDMASKLKTNVYDVIEKGVKGEKLSDDENEIYVIMNIALTMTNAVMAMKTGSQVPFSKDIELMIKQKDEPSGTTRKLTIEEEATALGMDNKTKKEFIKMSNMEKLLEKAAMNSEPKEPKEPKKP